MTCMYPIFHFQNGSTLSFKDTSHVEEGYLVPYKEWLNDGLSDKDNSFIRVGSFMIQKDEILYVSFRGQTDSMTEEGCMLKKAEMDLAARKCEADNNELEEILEEAKSVKV